MLNLSQIHPVSDFIRNYRTYLARIKETGCPEVLTVNGRPECVLVDAAHYQELSDAYEEARFVKAVNEGIESMRSGCGKSVDAAFEEIRSKVDL